ncbi:MAG: Gfo/Idh/MocA family oxidoreductase [Armatimonadetes bacterium]|nr:Gfo/Idh/MocA family oxidoreductase [Armatimonadota bacterium]MDW8121421.1 Gfo/Idh/MocA family oxidoreductase [Armatimonadota bacterium]
MTERIGVGVIGCGGISGTHLTNLLTINNVEVRVVCDIREEAARRRAEQFSVPYWVTDYEAVLADDRVRTVLVLVPQGFHSQIVIAAARAGKHIFCEKPMAMSVEQCRQMNEEVKKSGLCLQIGYVMRFSRDAQKIKEWLPQIGQPVFVRDSWAMTRGSPARWIHDADMGGGPLWENSHWLDFYNWLLGTPKRVYARLAKLKPDETTAFDTTLLIVDYQDGHEAFWSECWALPGFGWGLIRYRKVRPHLDLIGPKGSIHFPDPEGRAVSALFLHEFGDEPVETHPWESDWGATADGYRQELIHFFDCVRSGKEPICSGRDGQWAIEVAEGAVRSHFSGQPISLPLT